MADFPTDEQESAAEAAPRAPGGIEEPRRSRLRFTNLQFERSPAARCSAAVELEWLPGESVVGRADGVASPLGDLRVVADATLRAIEAFSGRSVSLELIGVKTMRAFDANIVMVSVLANTPEGQRRLLGCHLTDDDMLRSAVVATLQATNRVLGNAIATR
ncbi:MAG: hypothetical protein IT361_11790 [Gemmatimonadaceae bacterium]|nr:hypothetical protein [Gemmatimonadaceae bacterium]